jgi:phosphoglycolate phosphatase
LAGVPGVGVATGPSSADELRDAGASHVLTSLEAFPDWLDQR